MNTNNETTMNGTTSPMERLWNEVMSGTPAIETSKDEPVSNEPKRTIFEGVRSFNFYRDVTKVMRFNSYFTKLGFERVNQGKEFGEYTYYPQMTLMINPTLILQHDSEVSRDYKSLTLWNIQRGENSYDLWSKYFHDKKGYIGLRSHTIIKRGGGEEVKPLKIEYEGRELMLGQYLKNRNIVLLYVNPFNTDFSMENNEYLELVLKLFEEKMKEITLEKVDVSEKMKNAFIERFKKEINNKVSEVKNQLSSNENDVSTYQTALLKAVKYIQINRKQLEGLISFSTNTDETIKKAIEEVKQLPFVKNVRLSGSGISLDVGSIKINHNGEEVYIGDFYLIISPEGIKVYCKNPIISRDGQEVFHPHIDGNHNCYGGEREDKIVEFLATFELKKLVFFVYMFLKTYTPNDSYNNLSMWVRDDLKRGQFREIETEADVSTADFQGDYFQERRDNGSDDTFEDDEDESDENDDDDFVGECQNCSDNIYQSSNDNYCRDSDDNLFCCEECRDSYRNN